MPVVVISTGGTIASPTESDAQLKSDDLIGAIPELASVTTVETRDFAQLPSTNLTISHMYELAELITELDGDPSVEGIVVTHGTDILEESAYFVDLCYNGDTPVVFTGAMRNPSMTSPDGPANVLNSVRVVTCNRACNLGVLVVLGDRIHTARGVTKTHSMALDTFRSPEFGPLVVVDHDRIAWKRIPVSSTPTYEPDPDRLTNDILAVPIPADPTATMLSSGQESTAVCVGMPGAGNLPPLARTSLERLCEAGVPVIATTRCQQGRLSETSQDLAGLGVYRSDRNLLQTRIKTVVALAAESLDEAFKQVD